MELWDKIPQRCRGYVITALATGLACFVVGRYTGSSTTPIKVEENNPVGVYEQELDDQNTNQGKDISVKMQYGKRRVFLRQGDGSLRALLEIESDKIREVKDEADEIRNQSYVKE